MALTDFQRTARARVERLLQRHEIDVTSSESLTAQMPHMRSPETAVQIITNFGEIWLYADEATFSWDEDGVRFERPDYDSEEDLLENFLRQLALRIAQDEPGATESQVGGSS